MGRFLCVLIAVVWTSAAWAGDPHVACVQAQLERLGFQPGPVDGLNGPKTRAALSAHRAGSTPEVQAIFDRLPTFNKRSAVGWCREIAARDTSLRDLMPSHTLPDRFASDEVSPGMRTHLWVSFIKARDFVSAAYGVDLASQIDIVAAVTPEVYRTQMRQTDEGRQISGSNLRKSADRHCVGEIGGSMLRNVMTFCGSAMAADGTDLAPARFGLTLVMIHEYVHHMQRELSYDKTPRWVRKGQKVRPRMGPAWMVEGTADYIESQFARAQAGPPVPLFTARFRARMDQRMLRDIRRAEEVRTLADYRASYYGVYLLAERFGPERLITFWRAVGETDNWYTAFETTFGMTVQSFEALYPLLLTDDQAGFEFVSDQDGDGDGLIAGRDDLMSPLPPTSDG